MIIGGDDYEIGSLHITIPAGEINVPINISIIHDNVFEGNESFSLSLDPSSLPSRVLGVCLLMVTIVDDSEGKLCFEIFVCIIYHSKPSYSNHSEF